MTRIKVLASQQRVLTSLMKVFVFSEWLLAFLHCDRATGGFCNTFVTLHTNLSAMLYRGTTLSD